ncbi:hypothetical protein B2G71_21565 [Novosphingobium sp. PC22D]|uniref:hemerythrin domain-containing protein n=1 Tax=Novosphingobium sp. PC22D TaxID=1962403 RepID=UPI000BEFA698|nr:hemerythrin domain-containing protein [Novosphingobium sp. PC22D]PEQ10573.1 hypothetical protein B2G71_21565 [Novosphingobium sp. PC22D]
MSILDKVASTIMPLASDEDRAEARRNAEALAPQCAWLADVLEHHRQIELAFAKAQDAAGPEARQDAFKALALILTGHSNAEEAVLYPAVSEHSGKHHATEAYGQQSTAKVEMAAIEQLDPLSDDWREKLDHVKGAVEQHVYQEEKEWFPDVVQTAPVEVQGLLAERYREEFKRYCR